MFLGPVTIKRSLLAVEQFLPLFFTHSQTVSYTQTVIKQILEFQKSMMLFKENPIGICGMGQDCQKKKILSQKQVMKLFTVYCMQNNRSFLLSILFSILKTTCLKMFVQHCKTQSHAAKGKTGRYENQSVGEVDIPLSHTANTLKTR